MSEAQNETPKLSRAEQLLNRYKDEVKREQTKKRKEEDRTKIVMGGCMIAAMREDKALVEQVGHLLNKYVTKARDRHSIEQWLPQHKA